MLISPDKLPGKVLPIVKYGHPALRKKGARIETVTDEIRQLADDLVYTVFYTPESEGGSCGLAAHQVGVPVMMAVSEMTCIGPDRPMEMWVNGEKVKIADWMPLVMLNPEIVWFSDEFDTMQEGCMSVPDIYPRINRSTEIRVEMDLLDGRHIQVTAKGFMARNLQHEIDHLSGILHIDRMSAASKASYGSILKRMHRKNSPSGK